MKHIILASVALIGLSINASSAETTTVLNGVHNCCASCEKAILKATANIRDLKVTAKGGTITLVSKGKTDAKKAVEALSAAGFYGTTGDAETSAKPASSSSSADKKVKAATVSGVHLCCDKCRAAMSDAVKTVAGVTDNTAVAKATSFKVSGEFSRTELLAAINKAGFSATVK
jgi:hypothetical protein